MNYQVVITPKARRSYGKLPASVRRRVSAALAVLEGNPRPPGTIKLSGQPYWRLRVGEYRIIFGVSDRQRLVVVQDILRRTTTTYD